MGDDRGLQSLRRRNHVFFFFLLKTFGTVFIFLNFLVPSADAVTNPCTVSQFSVEHTDGTTSCEDCGSCPPGQGLSHECGKQISSNTMVTCESCQAGISFSNKFDSSSCTPCGASCSEDQVVLQNCAPTTNVKCDKRCYSMDRYYDYPGSCLHCSKCCGSSQDVIEDECKRKLGTASNMICSFHSSVNRCDILTKSSVKETKNTGTIASDGQSSPHPTKAKDSDQLIINVAAAVAVIIWLAATIVYYFFYLRRRSSSSSLWLKRGVQYSAKESQGSVYVSLNADSKLLSSLLNKDTTLQRICEVLDTPVPGVSNYKAVAQHYGFDHYQIASVLQNSLNPEGSTRTRALIEYLVATYPELTVEQFATVVAAKTKRNDVVKLLREYDLAEENNV